jgi:F-type H+-transporting ATPase subunit gamma
MNDIKTRMKSVTGTMQITKAMELVATSKLRRARERAERARPFFELSERAIAAILALEDAASTVYVTPKAEGETLYIVIAGDRGLAGGYNSNVFRAEAELSGADGVVLPVGKKAVEYYKRRGRTLLSDAYVTVSELGVGDAFAIAKTVCRAFKEGRFARVELVFTHFASMISQQVQHVTLLPLSVPAAPAAATAMAEAEDTEALLDSIVAPYIGGMLHAAVADSVASESGARRSAMNAANKNAEEMLDDLMLRFNRARQAVITQEITEIVSGAEAL